MAEQYQEIPEEERKKADTFFEKARTVGATGNYEFQKRPIRIGETFQKQGFAVVLSGLQVHDRVVSRATFFLDADRRLGVQAGEEGWAAP